MRPVFIIAEAGVNHNGDIDLAKHLIDKAVEVGADAVKFQTFKAINFVSKNAKKAEYQSRLTLENESQLQMLSKLELNLQAHQELMSYCKMREILFLSTPFDHESIEILNKLGMEIYKIPSGEITNLPYLRHIGSLQKQIILSTGMSDLSEVKAALNVLVSSGTKKNHITILHANTEYPTPMRDVNLKAMLTIKYECGVEIGYSDHTVGIEVDIAAVAMGARIIEKHMTLDKTMPGPDHKASIEPHEFQAMVEAIRNVEIALGNGEKKPSKSELKNIHIVRKSIVAKRTINEGEVFTTDNVTIKRPGNGISPMEWDKIIGTNAKRLFREDDQIC
jgi:N,N'-diacetyllegionaminate synthase